MGGLCTLLPDVVVVPGLITINSYNTPALIMALLWLVFLLTHIACFREPMLTRT
jgi:hypothetical protein